MALGVIPWTQANVYELCDIPLCEDAVHTQDVQTGGIGGINVIPNKGLCGYVGVNLLTLS